MWPPEVEEVAAVFRAADAEARLEELPAGEHDVPGPAVRAEAFACDGRIVVALVPSDRETDVRKLAAAARCRLVRSVDTPRFPYRGTTVLIERLLLGEPEVWIEAGSPRHVATLSSAQLAELVHAQAAELVTEA